MQTWNLCGMDFKEVNMRDIKIATGHYINIYGKGKDIYIIINEPNDVTSEMILKATTYLENTLEHRNLNEVGWNLITDKLEDIFPYGTHIVVRR